MKGHNTSQLHVWQKTWGFQHAI